MLLCVVKQSCWFSQEEAKSTACSHSTINTDDVMQYLSKDWETNQTKAGKYNMTAHVWTLPSVA